MACTSLLARYIPNIMMPTDYVNPSEESPEQTVEESTPPAPEVSDPELSDPPDTEDLERKLAAAEAEAKRWKGRAEKAAKPTSKAEEKYVTKEELWEQSNANRIELVKEQYDKIVEEGYKGETVSKAIALELAEKEAKIDTSNSVQKARQDDMATITTTTRKDEAVITLSQYDQAMGLTAEKKKELREKYPDLGKL